jgi:DNA-binding transcriptional ArsR family regulator
VPARAKNGADAKFRAFSDETRLRILHLLQSGELCVGDIVTILRVPQPTASRHLSYLRKAELVETRKNGQWIHYALAPARNIFHKKLLEPAFVAWRHRSGARLVLSTSKSDQASQ